MRYPGGNLGRENLGPCEATTWSNCTFTPWISSTERPLRRLLSSPCCCSGLSGRPSAVRLCRPCGSWCHGNTRTAPSAQSSSGWSPTHGESAGIRPSDVSKTTSRGHRAAKGERTSWGAATSSLCVYRGSGCVGPRVASVGPRGTHSGCDEIGPGGYLVGHALPIARFSMWSLVLRRSPAGGGVRRCRWVPARGARISARSGCARQFGPSVNPLPVTCFRPDRRGSLRTTNLYIENSAISRNGSEASVREPVRVCMGGLNHPTPAPN